MASTCAYNVFVGAETGLLKGIQLEERTWQNLNAIEDANKSRSINSLCWGNENKTELCAGLRDNCVITYDSAGATAREYGPFFGADGHIRTVAKYNDRFVMGFSKGSVAVWSGEGDEEDAVKFSTGNSLFAMIQNSKDPHFIATGGKETPLRLWDLNDPSKPVFESKNVKNDWLNLRVPIWVTKIQFRGNCQSIVAGTGHHQVRVYDPREQRRPVIDFNFQDHPLTGLSMRPQQDDQIMAANTVGDLGLLDLRMKGTVQLYKGFTGGISDIACHPLAPVVVSCSADRYVRIHDIDTKTQLDSFYLKSRLNCLLLADEWPQSEEKGKQDEVRVPSKLSAGGNENTEEIDNIWDSLEVVKTKTVAGDEKIIGKKRKSVVDIASKLTLKKNKKSSE